ncbi:MAG: hypothetical protein HFG88_04865 [Dorea sp.]|nr:hypothetical protein [Dorea sp.]
MKTVFEIMHGERRVVRIDTQGHCRIYDGQFMPYNLYLEENADDVDTLVNNVTNFYYWCASRVLTLDRQYAKEILNSIGASQAVTDRDRAEVALSYRCVSLIDIYWVKGPDEEIAFQDINLYDNHMNNAFVDISLRGKQITVQNYQLAQDLSTNGYFPKAWIREASGFRLLKGGGADAVEREVLASRICQCFRCRQVTYSEGFYDGERVSVSEIMTSKEYSIVSREAFEIYAVNHDIDGLSYILELDRYMYDMMNILDYLTGNTDRHWGNWGLLVDNRNNEPVSLHPLMDFNQSFRAYDTLEGARCQTIRSKVMTQKEAALLAAKRTGLNQISEIDAEWFAGREKEYDMFINRLKVLL